MGQWDREFRWVGHQSGQAGTLSSMGGLIFRGADTPMHSMGTSDLSSYLKVYRAYLRIQGKHLTCSKMTSYRCNTS